MADNSLDLFPLIAGLGGGLAIFLYGLEQLSAGLKAVAGERMKNILAKLTTNRFTGMITGAFVTAIIQSSSVTTVLVVGFISAGLMKLTQSVGIIMGANVGTTVTAQIIAFKITSAAMVMVAIGFFLFFFARMDKIKQYGYMIMGLGLVFLGMNLMSDAMRPLRTFEPFLDLMVSMEAPILGVLVGAAFTALVQSSSATTGIVIALASQGLLSLPAGIAIIFGANIGTCVTAMLAAIGKPREALQAAMVHVFFNVGGVLLWVAFIDNLANWVHSIGGDDSSTARDIANAHTIFNVANALIFIWFTVPLARLVEKLIPLDKGIKKIGPEPKYLDPGLVSTPSIAFNAVRLELVELGKNVQKMLAAIMPAAIRGTEKTLDKVAEMDKDVDQLHDSILKYIREVGSGNLSEKDTQNMVRYMSNANQLENIGDIIETDMVMIGKSRISEQVEVSEEASRLLKDLHGEVEKALDITLQALKDEDVTLAQKVIDMKDLINSKSELVSAHGAMRLLSEGSNRHHVYSREMEMVERMKRVYYFSKRISKTIIGAAEKEEEEEGLTEPQATQST